jgi:SAM-dependent methyltransferase
MELEWARAVLRAPAPIYRMLRALPAIGPRTRVHKLAPLRARLGRPGARSARIADVGGGAGELLATLRRLGFTDLTCVDPFLPSPGERGGVRFVRARLSEVDARFDVIMYHHSMEHVTDLRAELDAVADALAPGGVALLRLPLLPNVAFERYGADWIQIDAPRHIHVPSREGLARAVARSGLRVLASGDDSTMFQFWGSELYRRGVSWSHGAPRFREYFPPRDLREFARLAEEANARGMGDQGWVLLGRRADGAAAAGA